MILKCQCCGVEAEFEDTEEAFSKGWDAPPHFSYVCCNICPGVCVALRAPHTKAHAYWAKHGRPGEFTLAECCTDQDWDRYENHRISQHR